MKTLSWNDGAREAVSEKKNNNWMRSTREQDYIEY